MTALSWVVIAMAINTVGLMIVAIKIGNKIEDAISNHQVHILQPTSSTSVSNNMTYKHMATELIQVALRLVTMLEWSGFRNETESKEQSAWTELAKLKATVEAFKHLVDVLED